MSSHAFDRFNQGVFDREPASGLFGRLRAIAELEAPPTADTARSVEYDPNTYAGGRGGLVARLAALQDQQGQYRPLKSAENPGRIELARAIMNTSRELGIDPQDLATAISYETAGTFDPWKRGPVTPKYGQHRGFIQWGEPQAKHYGVSRDSTIVEQMDAVGRYLRDAGVTRGHDNLLDIYSAINAGRVGRYDRSDAGVGGAPGTVADKVNTQMDGHKANAAALLKEYTQAFAEPRVSGPSRNLVRRNPDDLSWVMSSAPIKSQPGIDLANGRGGPPRPPMAGLFGSQPVQDWLLPIFDPR